MAFAIFGVKLQECLYLGGGHYRNLWRFHKIRKEETANSI
nr:MAG TPA: hypothetical protein [Caudoviricetes sp.]